MSKPKENAWKKQIFSCPRCNFSYEGTMSRALKLHMKREHGITDNDWIDFLRNEYWPSNYPDKPTHCKVCGKETKFTDFGTGFSKYCSKRCELVDRHNDVSDIDTGRSILSKIEDKEKERHTKNNIFDFYDVVVLENPDLSPVNRDNHQQMIRINRLLGIEKKRKTDLEKYGVSHHSKSPQVRAKTENTCIARWGYSTNLKSPEQISKIRETWDGKSEDEYKEIYEKMKRTNLERYGVTCTLHNAEIREKVISTWEEKYGDVHPMKNPEIIKKVFTKSRANFYYDMFINKLTEKSLELLSSKDDYVNSLPLRIKCKLCGREFTYNYETEYAYCADCLGTRYSSSYEFELYQFLSSLGLEVWRNKRLITMFGRNFEIDLYLPDYKLGIEIDGLYWHSGGNANRHLNKTKALYEQKNSLLLHITDVEWTTKKEIVKSIILSKCGIYNRRIYARKCNITEINETEYHKFLINNHIQGYASASYRYGLYYKDELVAVCSFGVSRFKNGSGTKEYELVRFCSLLNTQIVGGLSKFIKYFLKEHSDSPLVSFCDLRFSDTRGYLASGFTPASVGEPKYWYWSSKEKWLHNRRSFQKERIAKRFKNYDPSLTEEENCFNNGWYRYYDCGSVKMLYTGNIK